MDKLQEDDMNTSDNKLRVALSADHGGFSLKQEMLLRLEADYRIIDMGAEIYDPIDDYPDFVVPVTRAILSGEVQRGIIICGSGVGACIAANKVLGIRAAVCHDSYSAHQGVEHDDMNVLCLGARIIGVELAMELAATFLGANFSGAVRHCRRLEKTLAIEKQALQGDFSKGES